MIICDDRKEDDTYYGLMSRGITDAEIQRIEIADVLLDDGYAIERKSHDLLGSIMSGRIWEQLNNLCQYEHPILCLVNHNMWRDIAKNKSSWADKSYNGFLVTLSISYPKLKFHQFECMADYLDFVIALDKKIHKEGTSSRPVAIHRKTKKISVRMEDALAMADGISIKKAKKLLEKFGNIYNVASVPVKELEEVDGIGKKLAQNMWELLHSKYKEK